MRLRQLGFRQQRGGLRPRRRRAYPRAQVPVSSLHFTSLRLACTAAVEVDVGVRVLWALELRRFEVLAGFPSRIFYFFILSHFVLLLWCDHPVSMLVLCLPTPGGAHYGDGISVPSPLLQ